MKARARVAALVIATSLAAVVGVVILLSWRFYPSTDDSAGCFPDEAKAGWGAHLWFVVWIGATIGVAFLIFAVRLARRQTMGRMLLVLLVGFPIAFVAVLVVLTIIAHTIWGPDKFAC